MKPTDGMYGLSWNQRPEDPTRCVEQVWPNERGPIPYQCQRKRGYGPKGEWCKQHDPTRIARTQDEAQAQRKEREAASNAVRVEGKRLARALGVKADVEYREGAVRLEWVYRERLVISFNEARKLIARMAAQDAGKDAE